MRKQFIIILLALLVIFGLMVSCKNEVPNAGFGEELVSISFREDLARGLTATLEGFDKDHLYWAYAAQKADGSHLISGQTAKYGEEDEVRVWVKTDGNNNPVAGLGETVSEVYKAYRVPGFSQGYWNFRLYAYKKVIGDNPATPELEDNYVSYVLVYQGEVLNVVLKNDSVNTQGAHNVSVIVNPVQSSGNGSMVFLTNKAHEAKDRISMNTVNSAAYGTDYTVKVLSILSMEELPVEYVGTSAEIDEATDTQDGLYSLPAGSYKVTVAFTDSASAPTVNYAKGTIVATVYSNLTTTISGDLTEAMTYAEFDGILNPDLETVTASNDQPIVKEDDPTKTVVLTTNTSAAKEVTATIKAGDTNKIINNMADTAGTNTDAYKQNLNLTLSVETVETTATTATYEIGMTAELKSIKISDQSTTTTTSDVSEVDEYVTVEVQLETGLTSVNVLHDGKQMIPGLDSEDKDKVGKFAYNGTTGVLTIKTMSFSPFEVSFVKPAETSYVAQVGKVKYQSLAAAISAAKTDGTDTITLLNDVSLTSETDISKKVVLDLAGYRITAAAGLKASVAETTVKNGNIDAALTISGTGVKLSAVAVKGSIAVSGSAAFDSDCSVTGTGDYAIEVTGSITIDGGTYTAAEGECILSGNAAISDGNFKGELAPSNAENIVLTGGTYSEMQAASRLAQGCECVEISDGVYMVRNIVEAVNVRTGVKYHYLQNAIDAASAGDTVKLLRDVSPDGTITVGDGVSITLDLAGLSLVGNVDGKFVNVLSGGTLVITDSSEGKTGRLYNTSTLNQGSDAVCCAEGGTLTIKAGNFGSSTNQRGGSVRNYGTTVIDGGTFTSIKNGIAGWAYSIINAGAGSLTLNGGEIYGDGQNGGIAVNSGTVEINYIKVNDNKDHTEGLAYHGIWITNDAENGTSVVVNGGYFKGDKHGLYGSIDDGKQDEGDVGIVLNGGTFIGNTSAVISAKGSEHNWNLDIYGGSYNSDPSTYVADGYEAIYSESTKLWTVSKITEGVASIVRGQETLFFRTIQKAVDAAREGETVVLLENGEVESVITVASAKNFTLDLNGKKIDAVGATLDTKDTPVFNNAGKLTIKGTTSGSAINAGATAVKSVEGSTLTVNGGSYGNKLTSSSYIFDINGTATIDSVTLTSVCKGIRAEGSGADVTVSGSSANLSPKYCLFGSAEGGLLTITSGKYTTSYSSSEYRHQMIDIKKNGKVIIKGGSFETKYDAADIPELVVLNEGGTEAGGGNCLTIEGGSFNYAGHLVFDHFPGESVCHVSITGGTYSKDPNENQTRDYVADGYVAIPDSKTAPTKWTVCKYVDYVLSLGAKEAHDVYYSDSSYAGVYGTMSDDVVYWFRTDFTVYIADATDFNGYHPEKETDATTYVFDELILVDGIEQQAFRYNTCITKVVFAGNLSYAYKGFEKNTTISAVDFGSMTRIPAHLLYRAYGLVSVEVPDTIESIGTAAFQECESLTSLKLPASLTAIPNNLVYQTAVSSMTIPSTVTSIGENAIRDVDLVTITIPAGVRSIGSQAFRDCESVSEIHVYIDSTDGLTIAQNAFSNVAGPYPTTYMYIYSHAVYEYIKALKLSSATHITLVDVNAPVAIIGDVTYTSLQAALDAVANGQTIELCKDIEIEEGLVFDKSGVTATLDLGKHEVACKSFDKNSEGVEKLLYIKSGSLSVKNGTLKNTNAEQDDSVYGIFLGANVSVSEITDVKMTVSGVGICLSSGSTLDTLNSDIHSYMDSDGNTSRWDAILLLDGSRIKQISGGKYLSEITYNYFDTHRSSKIYNACCCIYMESNSRIDLISNGEFRGTCNGANYAFLVQGVIDQISGGYFGFTVWNHSQTASLFTGWDNVTSISGGTFVSGTSLPSKFGLESGTDTAGFRNAIVSTCQLVKLEDTEETWAAFSKSDTKYTNSVYSVVPIN